MTRTQQIQLRQSEARQKMTTLLDTPTEERAETWTADLDGLKNELRSLESELQAALVLEPEPTETRTEETPEGREFQELVSTASVGDYMAEVAQGLPLDGASLELRQETLDGMGVGWIPLDVLMTDEPPLETRADASTDVSASIEDNQRGIQPRLFPASAGQYMGVSRPSVPVGDSTFVTLATGATADFRSDGVAKDAEVATFSTKTVSPSRVTARYLFGVESTVRYRGFEEALRADLSATLADKLDRVALQGQAAVTDVSPAIEGLISQLTNPTNPTVVATYTDFLELYSDMVDGLYSTDGDNVRVLTNPETFRFARKVWLASTGDVINIRLPDSRFRASANMPSVPASGSDQDIATALAYASGRRGFTQPVWSGAQILRDPYSSASEGRVALTIVMLTGAAMVDAKPYSRLEFKLA